MTDPVHIADLLRRTPSRDAEIRDLRSTLILARFALIALDSGSILTLAALNAIDASLARKSISEHLNDLAEARR